MFEKHLCLACWFSSAFPASSGWRWGWGKTQHALPVFDLHFSEAFALIAVWSLATGFLQPRSTYWYISLPLPGWYRIGNRGSSRHLFNNSILWPWLQVASPSLRAAVYSSMLGPGLSLGRFAIFFVWLMRVSILASRIRCRKIFHNSSARHKSVHKKFYYHF